MTSRLRAFPPPVPGLTTGLVSIGGEMASVDVASTVVLVTSGWPLLPYMS